MIRETYRRADLRTTIFNPWFPFPIKDADAEGFTYTAEGDGERFAWDAAIPFIIDDQERVHLVREVVIEGPDGAATVVHPPLVARAVEAGAPAPDAVSWTLQTQPPS